MRISDWSSDVCSSDLLGLVPVDRKIEGEARYLRRTVSRIEVDAIRLRGPGIERAQFRNAVGVGGLRNAHLKALVLVVVERGVDVQAAVGRARLESDLAALDQIGRASCREGVCQYV